MAGRAAMELKRWITDVPDFPKPGILFRDITPLLRNHILWRSVMDTFNRRYARRRINVVVGVEARGFLLAATLADRLGAGLVPVRKQGKLPRRTARVTYQLEYGTDALEMHADAIQSGDRVLIVDDVLATGGTMQAVTTLVTQLGGRIIELAFLIELAHLNGRQRLQSYPIHALVRYP